MSTEGPYVFENYIQMKNRTFGQFVVLLSLKGTGQESWKVEAEEIHTHRFYKL